MRVFFIPKMRRVILPLQLRPSTEAFFYPSSEVNFIFTLQLRGIIFIPSKGLLFIVSLLAQFLIKKSEIVTTHKKRKKKIMMGENWKRPSLMWDHMNLLSTYEIYLRLFLKVCFRRTQRLDFLNENLGLFKYSLYKLSKHFYELNLSYFSCLCRNHYVC